MPWNQLCRRLRRKRPSLFSYKAMEMILCAYRYIREHGKDAREPLYGDLLTAALYAGIAFGTAGCAAVHAMSYPLGVPVMLLTVNPIMPCLRMF